jgi:hypothetical protein
MQTPWVAVAEGIGVAVVVFLEPLAQQYPVTPQLSVVAVALKVQRPAVAAVAVVVVVAVVLVVVVFEVWRSLSKSPRKLAEATARPTATRVAILNIGARKFSFFLFEISREILAIIFLKNIYKLTS